MTPFMDMYEEAQLIINLLKALRGLEAAIQGIIEVRTEFAVNNNELVLVPCESETLH